MNQAWIGVIGTLLGVSIGGLATYLVNNAQFKRERKLKEQQLIQQKLEEICRTAEKIRVSNKQLTTECYGYMTCGRQFLIGNIFDESFSHLAMLNMLIHFYSPNLKELSQLLKETVQLHRTTMNQMYDSEEPKDKQNAFKYVLMGSQLIDKLCMAIIHGSAIIVREHFENKTGYFKKQVKNICKLYN